MKKTLYAIAALAFAFVGCTKEYNEIYAPGDVVTLHVQVKDALTKVAADNAGKYSWQAGDKISVLNDADPAIPFEFTTASGDPTFTCTSFSAGLGITAYYPASASHTTDNFFLEPEIAWKDGETFMPMIGSVDTGNKAVSFTTAGAVIKLVCYNVPDDARKLEVSSSAVDLSGEMTISGTAITTGGDGSQTISITFEAGHPSTMVFYIPVPTGDLGKLSFVMKDGSDAAVSNVQETKGAITMTQKLMVAAPALNCDGGAILWSEDWSDYSADDLPSDKTDRKGFGNVSITYTETDGAGTSPGVTKIYADALAEGTSPELLVGKKGSGTGAAGGTFTASGIPTNGASSLILKYKTNAQSLGLSSSTDGISFSPTSTNTKDEHVITITNSNSASTFDITFTATTTKNVRLDDILLTTPSTAFTAPSITVTKENLVIEKAGGSDNTTFTYSNPVDAIPVSAIVEEGATSWLSASIAGTTLTVTATANTGTERSAKVTLRATGTTKEITVTQASGIAAPDPIVLTYDMDGFPSSYGTANTFTEYTFGSYTYKIQQVYKNGEKMQWRAAGNANGTGTIYNTTAMPAGITSIVIVFDASDSNKNHTVQIGASENPTSADTITPTKSGNTYTYAGDGTSTYFVITNGNNAGYITSITIKFN